VKKVGRHTASKPVTNQEKSSPKGDGPAKVSLEARVAAYLASVKGDKSLGVFSSELGIPKESLSRYLNSEQSMTLGTLQKIADALGVSPRDILCRPQK